MKKTLLAVLKWYLIVAGAVATLLFVFAVGSLAYEFTFANKLQVNSAKPKDVRYVLNWAGLGNLEILSIPNSHESPSSFTGDHLTAYAIKVDGLTPESLKSDGHRRWYRGDNLPPNLQEAVKMINSYRYSIPWFPQTSELTSKRMYFFPWNLKFFGERLNSMQVIIARPDDGMIFFIGEKH